VNPSNVIGSTVDDASSCLGPWFCNLRSQVTSDSDFTRLATRIREQGLSVHGFGNKHVTHHALVAACNKFSSLSELVVPSDETGKKAILAASPEPAASTTQLLSASQSETHLTQNPAVSRKKPLDHAAIEGIRSTIVNNQHRANKDCFLDTGYVAECLLRLSPDLYYRNYGYSKLAEFLKASGIVEIKKTDTAGLVRLTDKQNAVTAAHTSVPLPPREETNQADPFLPSQGPVTLGRKPHDRVALESIQAAVLEKCQGDASSFVDLGGVCSTLTQLSPVLTPSDYGYSRLRRFILDSGIVELKMDGKVALVRLKRWVA
jgi:hypothetical protein